MQVKVEPKVDVEYWSHLFRLMGYARDEHKVGYELLNAGLEGRPLTEPYVLKLYELAARHFSSGGALDSYHDACLEFLQHNNVADAEKVLAKAARPPKPWHQRTK